MKQVLAVLIYFSALVFSDQSVAGDEHHAGGCNKDVWALSLDNDLFVGGSSDKDYTAGIAFTYAGPSGFEKWGALDSALARVDRTTFGNADFEITPSIEVGAYGFTPEDIKRRDLDSSDRPYSSLVYLSVGRSYVNRQSNQAWTSTLTLGVLGLDVFEAAQNAVHKITDSNEPQGWGSQVSDGGELTARYSLAYHTPVYLAGTKLKSTYYASVGYLTEVGAAISFRDGLISSPDHRFNPELVAYGERANQSNLANDNSAECYFWGGVAIKARAYNAFLEGQFKESEHTVERDRLNHVLAEAWLGYTHAFSGGFRATYMVRTQTSEISDGTGDRTLSWGGFVFSQTI